MIAIITATWYRPDNSSIQKLEKCWEFLQNQTYKEWVWFLTGDCYENKEEILNFVCGKEKINFSNMESPGERGKLPKKELWANAGATAMNESIKRAVENGFTWTAHLDDDDFWENNHLEIIEQNIRNFPNAVMMHTQARFRDKPKFPQIPSEKPVAGLFPIGGRAVHSSIAIDFSKIHMRYKSTGLIPADCDLLNRICEEHKKNVVHIPVLTASHLEEGVFR